MSIETVIKATKRHEGRGVCAENFPVRAPESDFEWIGDTDAREMLKITNTRQLCLESSLFDIMEYLKLVHREVKMMNRILHADLLDDYEVAYPVFHPLQSKIIAMKEIKKPCIE